MRLYLSGGIARVQDAELVFNSNQDWLNSTGYTVCNPFSVDPQCKPVEYETSALNFVNACIKRGEIIAKPGDEHSWSCYLRWDLIEMLKCDGVAVIDNTYWDSKGAMLEVKTAFDCGLPVKTVRQWAAVALTESISQKNNLNKKSNF